MAAGNIYKTEFARGIQQMPLGEGGEVVNQNVQITLASTRTPNDVVSLLRLPAGHVPVDMVATAADIDTGTSLTLSFGVMNAAETDLSTSTDDGGAVWLASSTLGQTGVIARPTTTALWNVKVNRTADRVIGAKVILAGSATAGLLGLSMSYRRVHHTF